MNIVEEDLSFNFSDALDTIKFDDDVRHGLSHCMKAVDFIVELDEAYLFVEVKDPCHPQALSKDVKKFKKKAAVDGKLQQDIVGKFRDSFLYRWAEGKLDKPVHFLSLITLEEALLKNLQDGLHRALPMQSNRWAKKMAESCHVLNISSWNRNFPKWQVRRLSQTSPTSAQSPLLAED